MAENPPSIPPVTLQPITEFTPSPASPLSYVTKIVFGYPPRSTKERLMLIYCDDPKLCTLIANNLNVGSERACKPVTAMRDGKEVLAVAVHMEVDNAPSLQLAVTKLKKAHYMKGQWEEKNYQEPRETVRRVKGEPRTRTR